MNFVIGREICKSYGPEIKIDLPVRNIQWCQKLRATFWEHRESEDTHEKSIFLLFRQNIPLGELIQGKIV